MTKPLRGHFQRLKAVEILLLWEGQASRPRLAEIFDVHGTVLSRDMAAYVAQVPDNCHYDTTARAYVATPYSQPHLTTGQFSEYEGLVGTRAPHGLLVGAHLVSTQQHATSIHYRPFSRLHAAVRLGHQVPIEYRSFRNPEAHERMVRPHAFIQAGPRWHLRAYCTQAGNYRDFNLGRITQVGEPAPTRLPGAEADEGWNREVSLRLVPHPDLGVIQAQLIRDEYMEGTTALVFRTRQALAKYVIRNYGAAAHPDVQHPPEFLLAVHQPEKLPPGTIFQVS